MAIVKLLYPIETIHGSIVHGSGLIFRKKHAHDEHGNILFAGKQECYRVDHPRDFNKTPRRGVEKENFDIWSEACRRTKELIQPTHPSYNYWRERWRAQLDKPDPSCPPSRKTGQPRSYYQFDCFVRVALTWEMKEMEGLRRGQSGNSVL